MDVKGAGGGVRGVSRCGAAAARRSRRARPLLKLSPFQPVERDFAFIVDGRCRPRRCCAPRAASTRSSIAEVRLFDVYTGPGVDRERSRSPSRSCCSRRRRPQPTRQLEGFSKRLVAAVEKATGGKLRGRFCENEANLLGQGDFYQTNPIFPEQNQRSKYPARHRSASRPRLTKPPGGSVSTSASASLTPVRGIDPRPSTG